MTVAKGNKIYNFFSRHLGNLHEPIALSRAVETITLLAENTGDDYRGYVRTVAENIRDGTVYNFHDFLRLIPESVLNSIWKHLDKLGRNIIVAETVCDFVQANTNFDEYINNLIKHSKEHISENEKIVTDIARVLIGNDPARALNVTNVLRYLIAFTISRNRAIAFNDISRRSGAGHGDVLMNMLSPAELQEILRVLTETDWRREYQMLKWNKFVI